MSGFGETVTLADASTIRGIFDGPATFGTDIDGPRVRLKTADVDAHGIDQGSVLTIRGSDYAVHGVQRDGVGTSICILLDHP